MSTMSVSFRMRSDPKWIKANVEIVRFTSGAAIQCVTCGAPALTQREFADAIGVPIYSLQKYLRDRTGRKDHIDRIKASVARIRDADPRH